MLSEFFEKLLMAVEGVGRLCCFERLVKQAELFFCGHDLFQNI